MLLIYSVRIFPKHCIRRASLIKIQIDFYNYIILWIINLLNLLHITTAIRSWKYPLSSDRGSQAWNGPVSTAVGDHAGILDAVVFFWFFCWKPPHSQLHLMISTYQIYHVLLLILLIIFTWLNQKYGLLKLPENIGSYESVGRLCRCSISVLISIYKNVM